MTSTSMPPPPSPLAYRRSRPHSTNQQDPSICLQRKMSLSKGATFHVPSSTSTDADPVLSIPHLARRSPTCSHSSLTSLLSEKRGAAAQSIADFEQTFSGARGNSRRRRQPLPDFKQTLKQLRNSLPIDEGLGSSIASPLSDKGISNTLERIELASNLDSGIGESLLGTVQENIANSRPEEDGLIVNGLIQDTDSPDNPSIHAEPTGTRTVHKGRHSAPYLPSVRPSSHPPLSRFARKKISQLLLQPLLREDKFKALHPLVESLAQRTHKNIRCLRDLEQSLIYQPLVSTLYPATQLPSNSSSKTRGFSLSPTLYRSFGELTVQLTVDTYQHLSESDQRRSADQPYSNGYFLDLVQQVGRLAAHIGSATRLEEDTDDNDNDDDDTPTADDEVTLEGGLGTTGEFAELVRWRNGKGTSLRTGLPYEPLPGIKRQHSSMTDEEVARSMARRKKGYIPELIEMPCGDPGCDKVFTRKCDLAKHQKTHSRPFKCDVPNCKYHDIGLPTEKELERHKNDKHDPNPRFFRCRFCEFQTKRESNCKQHMEKKHGWEYKRAKGKDKDVSSTPGHTPQTPAMDYSPALLQPSPAQASYHTFDDGSSVSGSLHGSAQFTPFDEPMNDFGTFNNQYSAPLFPRSSQPPQAQYVSPTTPFSFEAPVFHSGFDQFNGYVSPAASSQFKRTPATPAISAITPIGDSPYMDVGNMSAGMSNRVYWQDGLPTPESAGHHSYSRHPSVQYESPLNVDPTLTGNAMIDQGIDNIQVPANDFDLFAFSNPAAADQTLFPADGSFGAHEDFKPSMFENVDIDMDMDFDSMINYSGQ